MRQLPQENNPLSVSELNLCARQLLEETFQIAQVIGEVSNFIRASSGHWYFSLKDSNAQIRCAFFKNSQSKSHFIPENGQQVLVQARVSLYEPRGDYQLIVQNLQLCGQGSLQLAFEALKKKLFAEGLFTEEHKKQLPSLPNTIGVITSATGAAIADILHVLKRRFPSIPVIIYPTMVQGDLAAKQIVHALALANQRQECDVLILARGGGSLEDLWPFNEEIVARAIFESQLPIITGIGHEVDFTIADFVADYRAPTPSAAAETVSLDQRQVKKQFREVSLYLKRLIQEILQQKKTTLQHLHQRLRHPGDFILQQIQRLDQLEAALHLAKDHVFLHKKSQLAELVHTLQVLSPLNTLERGYAIVTHHNKIIREANTLKPGDEIRAQLAFGKIDCIVKES